MRVRAGHRPTGAGHLRTLFLAGPLVMAVLLLYGTAPSASASDEPFTHPANGGLTGLIETPNARVMPESRFRLGAGQVAPYRFYYGAISPLPRLEVVGKVTEVMGVKAFSNISGSSYGNTRDKAVDLKYQFLTEGKYSPALAIIIMDPHGTRIYPSQSIVASKQVYPFDFTLGFGNGRFGKEPLQAQGEGFRLEIVTRPKSWLSDSRFFGGVEFAPSDRFAAVAEYSPISYEKQTSDPAQSGYFRESVPSPLNFGIRWKPLRWAEIDVTWQRGQQIGVSVSTEFAIGRPMIPIYNPPYREHRDLREYPDADRIATALHRSGFSDIGVRMEGEEVLIEAQNDKYFYATVALEAILSALAEIRPENVRYVRVIIKDRGIPLFEASADMTRLPDVVSGKEPPGPFVDDIVVRTDVNETAGTTLSHKRRLSYGFKPIIQTFLNDPSGFFKYRLGLLAWGALHPWKGASAAAGVEGYPINTISTVNTPLSIPVRSDSVLYKQENVSLSILLLEQVVKFRKEIYGRAAAGLLEAEYAGGDAELAMPFLGGRVLAGISGSAVRKRDPDRIFGIKGDDARSWYYTSFLNGRIHFPKSEVFVDIKAGRFLAGDPGARITVSKFINGVVLSAWYCVTDTSAFSDEFNRGYNDKGIALKIPIRLFKGTDSRTVYSYSLSPWTRDTGQDVDHYTSLFDFIGRNAGTFIDKDKRMMYMGER